MEKCGFDAWSMLVLSRDFVGSAAEEVASTRCPETVEARQAAVPSHAKTAGARLPCEPEAPPVRQELPDIHKSSSASRQLLFSFNHPAPKPSSLPPSQLRVIN
jgi:hypothetical protein